MKINNHLGQDDSSDSDDYKPGKKLPLSEADIMKEKNRILMEKLFKS
jgi:hypothetical protein